MIGQDDNDLEESNEGDNDSGEAGDGSNEDELQPQEGYNSDGEESDVIQMAEDLDTDLDRLNKAREVEKQRRREAEKARRAKAARYSVGFIDEEQDEFNVTFNAGSSNSVTDTPARPRGGAGGSAAEDDVPSRNRNGSGGTSSRSQGVGGTSSRSQVSSAKDKRNLKRKQRGSTSSTGSMDKQVVPRRKTLRTSEIFPKHDWPMGMSEAQVKFTGCGFVLR